MTKAIGSRKRNRGNRPFASPLNSRPTSSFSTSAYRTWTGIRPSQLRQWLRAPIIILSARDQEKEKVAAPITGPTTSHQALQYGRVAGAYRVALCHVQRSGNDQIPTTFQVGDLRLDLAKRQVFVGDREVHLTPDRVQTVLCTGTRRRQGARRIAICSMKFGARIISMKRITCASSWRACDARSS